MGSKEYEITCLRDTIEVGLRYAGETRRILRELPMKHCSVERERPDFVFHIPQSKRGRGGILIGLEHFLVDQCCEPQNRREGVNSLAARRRREFEEVRARWVPEMAAGGDLPNEAISELMNLTTDIMADQVSAGYPELIKSFETVFQCHLNKVSAYRKNLRNEVTKGDAIKIGFLVELHYDMSQYAIASNKGSRGCELGDVLVFDDMLDIINRARGKVDFIVLSIYGNVDSAPRNVLAFKCGNAEKSITKQGVPICVFADIESDIGAFAIPRPKVTAEYGLNSETGSVDGEFVVERQELDKEVRIELLARSAMRAWNALRTGRSYVAKAAMVRFVEEFGSRIVGWRPLTDDDNEWRVRPLWNPFKMNRM